MLMPPVTVLPTRFTGAVRSPLVGRLALHLERGAVTMTLQPEARSVESSEIGNTVVEGNENTPLAPVVVVETFCPAH